MLVDKVTLAELIDRAILQHIQDEFSRYSGMAAMITDENGIPVTAPSGSTRFCMELTRGTELGFIRCENCDRMGGMTAMEKGGVAVYTCHAGLVDFAAPIIVAGRFVGTFIGGQVLTEPTDEGRLRAYAQEIGAEPEAYLAAARDVNIIGREEVERSANFLGFVANVISEMAYINYMNVQRIETSARSQTNYIMDKNRNMMKRCYAWSEFLASVSSGKTKIEFSDMVSRSSEMMRILQKNLSESIEYIQLTDGDVSFSETIYNVRELVEYIWKKTAFSASGGRPLRLSVSDDTPRELFGNSGQIGLVISKLFENSLHFDKSASVSAEIDAVRREYALNLSITVRDQGVGIDAQALEKIRACIRGEQDYSFAQDDERFSFSLMGMICRQMAGSLSVESELGKGTAFTMTLPQLEVR